MASEKKKMGGARPGAGRPKVIPGEVKCVSASLGVKHRTVVNSIKKEHKLKSNAEAIRFLIEAQPAYKGKPTVAVS